MKSFFPGSLLRYCIHRILWFFPVKNFVWERSQYVDTSKLPWGFRKDKVSTFLKLQGVGVADLMIAESKAITLLRNSVKIIAK